LNMPTARATYSNALLLAMEVKEDLIELQSGSANQTCEVSTSDLNLSSANDSDLYKNNFGEAVISFRRLLKRFVGEALSVPAAGGSANVLKVTAQILPVNNLAYGATSVTFKNTLFSYLRYAYVGIRGSIRVNSRIYSGSTSAPNYGMWTKLTLAAPTTSFSNTNSLIAIQSTDNSCSLEGSLTFLNNMNAVISGEIPYYSNNLFQLCFSDTYDDSSLLADNMEATWFRNFVITYDNIATSATGSIIIEKAAGEDLDLMRFQGAPFYSAGIAS